MKHEWRKHENTLYKAGPHPACVEVPTLHYLMLDGRGDPNGPDFSRRVAALYALAYAVKMDYKFFAKDMPADAVHDFAVYPLEGVWRRDGDGPLVKEELVYTLMLRQPDFIVARQIQTALERVQQKKPDALYAEIRFGPLRDGLCVQLLHTGSYDDEPASFEAMDRFAARNSLRRTAPWHREIYLSDARRTEAGKRKTILRYPVERAARPLF